jgi:imidazolonepropionase-like amidohydrolase
MVTVDAAKALGMEGRRGVIEAGAIADLVAFPLKNDEEPWSFLFEEGAEIEWVMVGGEVYRR